MSDQPPAPGWWKSGDGGWHAPEDLIHVTCPKCGHQVGGLRTATALKCQGCATLLGFVKCGACGQTHTIDRNWDAVKCSTTGKTIPNPLKPTATAAKKASNGAGCAAIAVLIVVVLVIAGAIDLAVRDHGVKFSASVERYAVVDPATVEVVYTVHNAGSKDAKPHCTVEVSGEGSAYTGVDVFDLSTLAKGDDQTYRSPITVTNEGAAYVTDATVKCEAG